MDHPKNEFPRSGFARAPEVIAFTGYGRSKLWDEAKNNQQFPKPIKLSGRVTVWDRADLWAWYERQKAKPQSPPMQPAMQAAA